MAEEKQPEIILLNGGPRKKGNTMQVASWVAEGAAARGARIQKIHLLDHTIKHCLGCEECAGTGFCIQKDDFQKIFDTLQAAQGMIIVSPVYAGSVSSVLKTFTDRTALTMSLTGSLNHLCSVGVTTARADFTSGHARKLAGMLNMSWLGRGYVSGYIHKTQLSFSKKLVFDINKTNSPDLYRQALRMGNKLVADIQQGRRGKMPLWQRMVFKHIVMPKIAEVAIKRKERYPFYYEQVKRLGFIDDALEEKVLREAETDSESEIIKSARTVKFYR